MYHGTNPTKNCTIPGTITGTHSRMRLSLLIPHPSLGQAPQPPPATSDAVKPFKAIEVRPLQIRYTVYAMRNAMHGEQTTRQRDNERYGCKLKLRGASATYGRTRCCPGSSSTLDFIVWARWARYSPLIPNDHSVNGEGVSVNI